MVGIYAIELSVACLHSFSSTFTPHLSTQHEQNLEFVLVYISKGGRF